MTQRDQTKVRGTRSGKRASESRHLRPVREGGVHVYCLAGSTYNLKVSLADDQALETPLLPDWKMPLSDLFAA